MNTGCFEGSLLRGLVLIVWLCSLRSSSQQALELSAQFYRGIVKSKDRWIYCSDLAQPRKKWLPKPLAARHLQHSAINQSINQSINHPSIHQANKTSKWLWYSVYSPHSYNLFDSSVLFFSPILTRCKVTHDESPVYVYGISHNERHWTLFG